MSITASKEHLEELKLRLEIRNARLDLENRAKTDALQLAKLQCEVDSLTQNIGNFNRYEIIRVWAPALSLFLSILLGTATLLYQNFKDHEFRMSQDMIKLMTEIQSKDDGTQISAARSLGLMGKGVETVLVEGLRTEHTEEFYHAIPRALLDSVQHGNKPEPVVSVILSEIRSTCEHDPTITSIKRAKRYATTLQEIMLDFSTTQSVNVMSSLHNQVTAARPQLHKTVANIRDDRAREELDTIIDSLSGSN